MTEVGEPVGIGMGPQDEEPESKKKEPCKRIYLHAFGGDRSKQFLDDFKRRLQASKDGTGPSPSTDDVLLWSGHVGVSFEAQSPIYGFNPKATDPVHVVVDNLKKGDFYPGEVTDDTSAFNAAKQRGLKVVTVEFVYPESRYNEIKAKFDAEKGSTGFKYSFPGGGGDCNCATFPARIGLTVPEATGIMKHYMPAIESAPTPQRKGQCEG